MSDLRISNAPKERSRAGRSRGNAPDLTGVNSVLALETKILMAVSSWAKHVHEKLIPGSYPAHADVPVLNNAEFELLNSATPSTSTRWSSGACPSSTPEAPATSPSSGLYSTQPASPLYSEMRRDARRSWNRSRQPKARQSRTHERLDMPPELPGSNKMSGENPLGLPSLPRLKLHCCFCARS